MSNIPCVTNLLHDGDLIAVAALVDTGRIRSTATEVAGKIDASTLRAAHNQIESGSARGKIVLAGY